MPIYYDDIFIYIHFIDESFLKKVVEPCPRAPDYIVNVKAMEIYGIDSKIEGRYLINKA